MTKVNFISPGGQEISLPFKLRQADFIPGFSLLGASQFPLCVSTNPLFLIDFPGLPVGARCPLCPTAGLQGSQTARCPLVQGGQRGGKASEIHESCSIRIK